MRWCRLWVVTSKWSSSITRKNHEIRLVPEHMRIGAIAPNDKIPLARLHFLKDRSARAVRNNTQPPRHINSRASP